VCQRRRRCGSIWWRSSPAFHFALEASTVIIAAGAFSKRLASQAGDNIHLEKERGYHLEYKTESPLL
jgi:D-amino-acid dehydrogenase